MALFIKAAEYIIPASHTRAPVPYLSSGEYTYRNLQKSFFSLSFHLLQKIQITYPVWECGVWSTVLIKVKNHQSVGFWFFFLPGRHCTVSAAASRRHVDASLDLFTRKSPRTWRDLSEKKALSARRPFFCGYILA